MKPPRAFLVLLFVAIPSLYGQTEKKDSPSAYTLTLDFTMGSKYGQAEEIVYKNSFSPVKLSELLWDLKPLLYWGFALNYSRRNPLEASGFFISTALQAAVPMRTGVMEDRDWMGVNDALSHFSIHKNYTDSAWFFELNAGLSLPFASSIWMRYYLAFNYMGFNWTAREGYKQYAKESGGVYEPWDPDITKSPIFGPGIIYAQDWFIFAPGVSLHVPFSRYFRSALYFQISPLVMAIGLDDHLLTGAQYTDTPSIGLYLEPRGEFVFSPHDRFDISLNLSYRFIKGLRGNTLIMNTSNGSTATHSNIGGAAYYSLDAGLSLTIRL